MAPAVNQQRGHQRVPAPQTSHSNYIIVEEISMGKEVLVVTFFLFDQPIIILFNSRASHHFMSSACAKKAKLSLLGMKAPYVISTLGGRVDADRIVQKIPLDIHSEAEWMLIG
jgi:hypothetical protein